MEGIPVHEKIKIEFITPNGLVSGNFHAVIEEQNSKTLSLALLPSEGIPSGIKSGQLIRGTFLEEGALYKFNSKIISINKEKTGLDYREIVKISQPPEIFMEEMGCYQRIGFTGIEGLVPFRYEIVKRGEMTDVSIKERGAAIWLGGDSLVMISVAPLPAKALLAIQLEIPKQPSGIKLFGKVVCMEQKEGVCEMDVHFEGLREKDRDVILAYILARQAELRRSKIEEGEKAG